MRTRLLALTIALASIGAPAAADDEDVVYSVGNVDLLGRTPSYVHLGAGVFDILDRVSSARRSAAGEAEVRIGEKLWGFGPAIGILANTQGGVYGYVSSYSDVKYRNFVFTPFAGLGGYAQGDGSDLGGIFQFRLGLGAAWRLENLDLVGLRVAHISNAGSHTYNPGEEELYLTYAISLP